MPSSKVYITDYFKRVLKRLAKKHRSLNRDVRNLIDVLEAQPYTGDRIGEQAYKIRLAIRSKGRGKSGGARVFTYINVMIETVEAEDEVRVYLIDMLDKGEAENLPTDVIAQRVAESEEIEQARSSEEE